MTTAPGVSEIDPRLDSFLRPERPDPFWSEQAHYFCFSPENGVGLFVRPVRCPYDLDLWSAKVAVFLPDGDIVVGQSWGRSPDGPVLSTGNLEVRVHRPLHSWSVRYDGGGERTTTAALAERTAGGGPARPLRFDIDSTALRPAWNMLNTTSVGHADDWGAQLHIEQTWRGTGSVAFDGTTYAIDGYCWGGRSRGSRTFASFGGDIWVIAAFPEFSVHAIRTWDKAGATQLDAGNLVRPDGDSPVRVRFPTGTDMLGNPRDLDVTLQTPEGEPVLMLTTETLHVLPLTISEDRENRFGIAWDAEGDPLFFTESVVRLTTPDGQVGYGTLERSTRRSATGRFSRSTPR